MPGYTVSAARIPLIMTRPKGSNARFIDAMPHALRARFHVVISPLMEIVPLDAKPDVAPGDEVIFTSANGVRFAPPGQGRTAYCVGAATSHAAAQSGWQSQCLGDTSAALIADLSARRPKAMLWHLSGVHARGDVVEQLSGAGLRAARHLLYDQQLLTLSPEAVAALAAKSLVIVPLFSPRTAAHFARICPKDARPFLLALSQAVAEPLGDLDLVGMEIVAVPNAQAMLEGLEKLASRVRLG